MHQLAEDESHEEGHHVESHHDHRDGLARECRLLTGDDGEVGGVDEEDHHQQQHADHRRVELQQLTRLKGNAALVGRAQLLVGQPQPHHHHGDEAHQIDQEGVVPLDGGQQARQERSHHTAHLVHRRRETHQPRLLLGWEVVGQQARRQRHDEADADAQQGPHQEQHVDVVDKEASPSGSHIEQQARGGDAPCAQVPADAQEEEVGDDNQQRGHADNELYGQRRCRRKMSLDDAQCRGDGGSCHHGEQRHRQDGSRHSFRHVFLFHKNKCGVQSSTKL